MVGFWALTPTQLCIHEVNKCIKSHSLFFHFSGSGSRGQYSVQECSDFLFPRYFFQLFQKDSKVFPGQSSNIASPVCPGSSWGLLPAQHAQNASWGMHHLNWGISAGSSHCRGAVALLQTPPRWHFLSPFFPRRQELSAQLLFHHDRQLQRPHCCSHCTDPPVNLTPHPSLNTTPKILWGRSAPLTYWEPLLFLLHPTELNWNCYVICHNSLLK